MPFDEDDNLVSIRVFMSPDLRHSFKVKAAQLDRSMNDLVTGYLHALVNGVAEPYPSAPRDESGKTQGNSTF